MPHLPTEPTQAMLDALSNMARRKPFCPRETYRALLEAAQEDDEPEEELKGFTDPQGPVR